MSPDFRSLPLEATDLHLARPISYVLGFPEFWRIQLRPSRRCQQARLSVQNVHGLNGRRSP